jgi:hypothetical protein
MIMFIMMYTVFTLITLMMLVLCMLYLIGTNIIPGLIKMVKILKVRINC